MHIFNFKGSASVFGTNKEERGQDASFSPIDSGSAANSKLIFSPFP